jgi:hypothetical protein
MLEAVGSARFSRLAWQYGLMGFCILILLLFLVYPILLTVRGGFYDDPAGRSGFTFRHLIQIFDDPRTLSGLFNSSIIASGKKQLTVRRHTQAVEHLRHRSQLLLLSGARVLRASVRLEAGENAPFSAIGDCDE